MNLSSDRAKDPYLEKKPAGGFFSTFNFFGRSPSTQSPVNPKNQQFTKTESQFSPQMQNVV